MIKFEKFTGINNVLPGNRLQPTDLATATDVDVGMSGELLRRRGFTSLAATDHRNLWEGDGFMLATHNNDLVKTVNGTTTVLYPSLGSTRVWYCNLPDGRTTFSNGLIHGVTDGITTTDWGVPIPAGLGALTDVAGQLFPGDYQYQLTYVRLTDGLEGAPIYSNPLPVASGGIVLTGLPTLAGHKTNVYITGANGGDGYLAGSTAGSTFSFTGKNSELVLPCRTGYMDPMPVGTVTAFWRGRVLVAEGSTLWASRAGTWELCDKRRDFKQFSAPITLIQPVDEGLFVGTTDELVFLGGTEFDKLVYTQVIPAPVVLGSGVEVRGELLKQKDGRFGTGRSMICIADGMVVAGHADGSIQRMTEGVYKTTVTEVAATFRMIDHIPQYIAVPL